MRGTAAPLSTMKRYERLKFCERMHWTFEQYDAAKAGDIAFAWAAWRVEIEARG